MHLGCQIQNIWSFRYWFSIHEIALFVFWGFLAPTPLNMTWFCWDFLQRHYLSNEKKYFKNLCKIYVLTETGWAQSLHFQSNFDPPSPFPSNMAKIKKKIFSRKNFSHRAIHIWQNQCSFSFPLFGKNKITSGTGLSKYVKIKALSPLPFKWKIQLLWIFWAFLGKNQSLVKG